MTLTITQAFINPTAVAVKRNSTKSLAMAKQLISALEKKANKNNSAARAQCGKYCGHTIMGINVISDSKQPYNNVRRLDPNFSDKNPCNGEPTNQPKKIMST